MHAKYTNTVTFMYLSLKTAQFGVSKICKSCLSITRLALSIDLGWHAVPEQFSW